MDTLVINEIHDFDHLKEYLKRPIKPKKIYKIMSKYDFERSRNNNYLFFNRIDRYPDKNDGLQLLQDSKGNKKSTFEKNPNFNWYDHLNNIRKATFACCFSTIENKEYKKDYGSQDESGKVLLTINLSNFLKSLQDLRCNNSIPLDNQIYLCFSMIRYVDWNNCRINKRELQNYISYVFIKDKENWKHEKEFRLVLLPNPLAINTYNKYDSLFLKYDINKAVRDKIIESILVC
ncbi:hypothetical protein A8135_09415 [Legionella jamestowniensis]|uniref:Uncharacterized protein n=1 Tax=Legionella jamestowniensis TaxID=455 RepID=A0ABX2XWK2_9GAMM|nr:hypothetical protein [Legionella jamestowniensis]OCH98965.1 hypothetical protein A8135_09415 [Legionella jamestowniensis]